PRVAFDQSGFTLIAAPKPTSPSMMSCTPVTPLAAAIAASTPDSAACAACMGLVIASERKACCRPAANVPTVPSAFMNCSRLQPRSVAAAAAAPKQPTVPVVCQYL